MCENRRWFQSTPHRPAAPQPPLSDLSTLPGRARLLCCESPTRVTHRASITPFGEPPPFAAQMDGSPPCEIVIRLRTLAAVAAPTVAFRVGRHIIATPGSRQVTRRAGIPRTVA